MNLRLRYFIEFYLNEMQHSQTLSIFKYDHITLFDIFCMQNEIIRSRELIFRILQSYESFLLMNTGMH